MNNIRSLDDIQDSTIVSFSESGYSVDFGLKALYI